MFPFETPGFHGNSPAPAPLYNLLRDTDPAVRAYAVRVPGDIGDPDAGPALVRSLMRR